MDDRLAMTMKWGGTAGIVGSLLLLGVFALLATFVGFDTLEAETAVARFPDIRWARVIENTAYLLTLALWTLHSVTLFMALRENSPGAALAACVFSAMGLTILATGAIPHTAETAIAALYNAPGTTADLKPVLVAAWQVSMAWVATLVITGVVLTPLGMLLYGVAMLREPAFGSVFGWISILLGLAGGYAAVASLIESGDIVAIGVFALIFFHIIVGWRSLRHPN